MPDQPPFWLPLGVCTAVEPFKDSTCDRCELDPPPPLREELDELELFFPLSFLDCFLSFFLLLFFLLLRDLERFRFFDDPPSVPVAGAAGCAWENLQLSP